VVKLEGIRALPQNKYAISSSSSNSSARSSHRTISQESQTDDGTAAKDSGDVLRRTSEIERECDTESNQRNGQKKTSEQQSARERWSVESPNERINTQYPRGPKHTGQSPVPAQ
jgi:hypothetical protein